MANSSDSTSVAVQPQTLAELTVGRGGTWNADGVILFARNNGQLLRVPASGGEPVAATTLDGQNSQRFPYFLPDGRQYLFWGQGTPEKEGIYLASLDSMETTRLTSANAT